MEIEFYDEQKLSKSDYINFKFFVLSLCFKGRTAASDQSMLIALIDQHIEYTNGKSGVRPGVRKMRTATGLNKSTVNRSLGRLSRQGWIEKLCAGNREGSATIWRVNFSNPPVSYVRETDYQELVNPLAEFEVIWTKYCLGARALMVINALHNSLEFKPNGLICSEIMAFTGSSRTAVNKSLVALMNFNLVSKKGRFYLINPDVYKKPLEYYLQIFEYYSVYSQKEIRINLHKLESRHTAAYRSRAREAAIQHKIAIRWANKYSSTRTEGFNYNTTPNQLEG